MKKFQLEMDVIDMDLIGEIVECFRCPYLIEFNGNLKKYIVTFDYEIKPNVN